MNQNQAAECNENEEARIHNIVGAVILARQAAAFENLDERIAQIMEQRLESTLSNVLARLNLNHGMTNAPQPQVSQSMAANAPPNSTTPRPNRNSVNSTPIWARDDLNNPDNFHRQIDQFRFSDISSVPNSGRIAQLIASWDIKFDGSSKLSVDNFLYRIESQVIDTLGGNFNVLCEHVQSLFTNEAKDWYWRYRRSVERVTWPTLCQALRTNFQEHRTDTEIKELIRARKQCLYESFDDFRNAILKLAEGLQIPLPELELVEILQRNSRPRIRQQLLYVPVTSLAELRKLCLKGENLLNEVSKSIVPTVPPQNQRHLPRRLINELYDNDDIIEGVDEVVEIDDIHKNTNKTNLVCWYCRAEGHRFFDCLADRTIFCYGCGSPGIYKPNCTKCRSENLQKSEVLHQNPRYDTKHKT
ncbi:uncharacterized protein LOC118734185 [Rhagoletis pomonella]|uniref:uncharacterized protein LOC118734185 n=1 Tax=Rhagoletis pomonella TaxID=28610 RepID=UPI0017838BCE|nr:uncharacterized protein LOC118734185 [Rhagoletis pomonella]